MQFNQSGDDATAPPHGLRPGGLCRHQHGQAAVLPASTASHSQPALPPSKLMIDEIRLADSTIVYHYDGVEYAAPAEALAALRRTEDAELAAVQPAAAPVGGSLRIVL